VVGRSYTSVGVVIGPESHSLSLSDPMFSLLVEFSTSGNFLAYLPAHTAAVLDLFGNLLSGKHPSALGSMEALTSLFDTAAVCKKVGLLISILYFALGLLATRVLVSGKSAGGILSTILEPTVELLSWPKNKACY